MNFVGLWKEFLSSSDFTLQNMQMLHKNKRPSKDMAAWEKKSLQLSHHPRKDDSTGGGVAKQGKTDGE